MNNSMLSFSIVPVVLLETVCDVNDAHITRINGVTYRHGTLSVYID